MRAIHFNATQAFTVPSPQIKEQKHLNKASLDSIHFGHGKIGPNPNSRKNDEFDGFKRLMKNHLIPKQYAKKGTNINTRFEQWKAALKPHFISTKNHTIITQKACNQQPYNYGKSG